MCVNVVGMQCSIEGCADKAVGRGWCWRHWRRWRRHGDPTLAIGTPIGAPLTFLQSAMGYEGDGCLTWPYGLSITDIDGRKKIIFRCVCERRHGPPPSPRHEAAHSCGKAHLKCISPNHLSWKTPKENAADKLIHGTHTRGDRDGMAKLTAGDVRQIRSLHCRLPQKEIGALFDISSTYVSAIQRRVRWGWLPD